MTPSVKSFKMNSACAFTTTARLLEKLLLHEIKLCSSTFSTRRYLKCRDLFFFSSFHSFLHAVLHPSEGDIYDFSS